MSAPGWPEWQKLPSAPPPAPRPSFFAYVVVDITATPATPLEVKLTRAEARKVIQWRPDADHLRIRRAKVTLYTK